MKSATRKPKCDPRINELISSKMTEVRIRESARLTYIRADKRKVFAIATGLLLIAIGLIVIFAFSTQILIPAQPATLGHCEEIGGHLVWRDGRPSQPEHFERSFPNLPAGLIRILAGSAISATGLLLPKLEEHEASLSNPTLE
jgi:hypothetical protein